MKIRSLIIGIMVAGGALGVVLPRQAMAVTDEEFRALQQQMQQQSDQIQDLQKARQEDKQEIQKLKDQLGVTQKTTDDTQKKVEETQKKVEETQQTTTAAAEAAAKLQPIHPVPSEGMLTTHNVSLVGDAEVQFVKPEGQHGAFMFADFAPIFLYRAGDNVLFEAGFDIALHNNFDSTGARQAGSSTSVDLSFATLDYLFNDYITLVAGDMVLPLGTYSERAAGWLNKIPDDPLPRSVLPGSGIGLQLRGSKAIGDSGQMVTYAIYGANGPSSTNGTGMASALDLDGNVGDTPNWHSDPSAGGRIGWFYPLKAHYDLELGVSGQSGTWDDAGKELWSAMVVDAALHLSPYIEVKGEWIYTWQETDDRGTIAPRGWWVQAGYKLAALQLELPMVNNLELVYRYDTVNDGLGTHTDRNTVGCVYYITNTFQFESDYEFVQSNDPTQANNELIVQLSYGF
jgi:type II secretory pathway pseudopilin PulG